MQAEVELEENVLLSLEVVVECRTAAPMLGLGLFTSSTVRGATIAQVGTAIAMAGVMFGLIFQFQFAYGWRPVKAGLANLPIIVTMVAATPLSESFAKRYGNRMACFVGAGFLAASLAGLAWAVTQGYLAIAIFMVTFTIGLQTVMTICAVSLVDAMSENRTSIGTALNDTAQEVGSSVGTAIVGTLIATLATTALPAGAWSSELVASFFHAERITYAALAVVVGLIAGWGAPHRRNALRERSRARKSGDSVC